MLLAIVVVGLPGCFAASGGDGKTGSRPGVMPMLSELPGDPQKRDAILDQSNATPGPELRKGQTKKERRAETAAAGVAAIIGSMFSTTQNVTLGSATVFDENDIGPSTPVRPHPENPGGTASEPAPNGQVLVPWIKLTPAPGSPEAGDAPAK